MLNFYVRHGMVVQKIRAVISFKQSRWLEKYNSFNTKKRKGAKKYSEKDFFKLLVNAAFGKFWKMFGTVWNKSCLKKLM